MTRPAEKIYTSGLCQVDRITPTLYRVTSKPPLHSADAARTSSGAWQVTVTTVPMVTSRTFYASTMEAALERAGSLVSRAAGRDMMRFTGPQRTAMGQQQCPKVLGTLGTLCRQPAGVGTVWCEWHPGGKVRTDD